MSQSLSAFVLVVHTLLAAGLVAVILMQRSEGGALGIGGGPGGLMSARGAGNLLTTATKWLAAAFIGTSLLLAIIAAQGRDVSAIDTSLADPTGAAPALADDVQGDVPSDPGLAAPTQDLDQVPFAIPGAETAPVDDEVPVAE
jgi:preprotein translocase subunit SecG